METTTNGIDIFYSNVSYNFKNLPKDSIAFATSLQLYTSESGDRSEIKLSSYQPENARKIHFRVSGDFIRIGYRMFIKIRILSPEVENGQVTFKDTGRSYLVTDVLRTRVRTVEGHRVTEVAEPEPEVEKTSKV